MQLIITSSEVNSCLLQGTTGYEGERAAFKQCPVATARLNAHRWLTLDVAHATVRKNWNIRETPTPALDLEVRRRRPLR